MNVWGNIWRIGKPHEPPNGNPLVNNSTRAGGSYSSSSKSALELTDMKKPSPSVGGRKKRRSDCQGWDNRALEDDVDEFSHSVVQSERSFQLRTLIAALEKIPGDKYIRERGEEVSWTRAEKLSAISQAAQLELLPVVLLLDSSCSVQTGGKIQAGGLWKDWLE